MLEGLDIDFFSLDEYPDLPEVIEDGKTFFENALKKAKVVSEYTGEIVVADDSGLEVDFLGGRPGICSSRYAGPDATDERNNEKLLEELKGVPINKRDASFVCALVLYRPDGTFESFEGRWGGLIGHEPAGTAGFGYDPVFVVAECGMTVAQLSPDMKNTMSHRAKALNKLKKSLEKWVKA
jgi:XTP/dITP diphosphohydrolase